MQKIYIHRTFFITLFILILSLVGFIFLVNSKIDKEKDDYRYYASLSAKTYSANLQKDINQCVMVGEILKYVISTTSGNAIDFESMANEIQKNRPYIKKLALARNGVISDIYPTQDGAVKSQDYLHDEITADYSIYSIKHKTSFITGPFTLDNGKKEIAINTPVYINSIGNSSFFWGFISVIIDPEEIFKATAENLESSGYKYSLYKTGPLDHNFLLLMGTKEELNDPVNYTFEQSGSLWKLMISPINNWDISDVIDPVIYTGMIGILLLSFLVFVSLKLREKEVAMRNLSEKDELTMLSNLRSYEIHLKKTAKKRKHFGLIYADIDRFKQINDIYGHHIGNLALQETAYRLEKIVNPYKVFRIGGDEFVILVSKKLSREGYNKLINTINKAFEKPIINTSKYTIQTGISTGYACTDLDGMDYNDLRTLADKRMYACKFDRQQKRSF